ncbi:hypothetical protein [Nocardioides sp. B-3]|uniref:hypothetical protein n=1 Tax=Nocardioides sp. B-3 TaxID=2895565 RepID=UPI00215363B5|nr:hypothetical protein [Nocardioides sp. B-3]UUZ61895.1 hypothetical protein LP418_16765 [Nocardioides sp. B-3]
MIAIGALLFGAVLGFEAAFGQGALFWPVVIALSGVALLWRQADEAQRERWLDSTGRIDPFRAIFGGGGWAAYFRVFAGLSLVVTALILFAVWSGSFAFRGAGDHRGPAGRRRAGDRGRTPGAAAGARPRGRARRARSHP